MTQNEISNYESLKKQDTANRKLIKKLQLDKQALKEQLILSGVSHRRELLKAWEIHKDESHYNRFEVVIESDMDDFLKSLINSLK